MNHNKALVIVDAQRGFMPAEEGERLGVAGFGELPVPNGQSIVRPINGMTGIFLDHGMPIATTQDNHPEETAHFSAEPNFIDTWPAHCIAGTPGAELHPELLAATHQRVAHFVKGDVSAKTPENDDSYTGVLAHRFDFEPIFGLPKPDAESHPALESIREMLPDYLRKLNAMSAYVCGLTVGKERPLCVDSTAIDLKKQGFEVTVVTDAVEAVVPEDFDACMQNLGDLGIRLMNSHEVVAEVAATPEEVLR